MQNPSSPFSNFDQFVVKRSLIDDINGKGDAEKTTHLINNLASPKVPRLDTRKIVGLHSIALPNSVRELSTARDNYGKRGGGSNVGVSLISQIENARPKTHRPEGYNTHSPRGGGKQQQAEAWGGIAKKELASTGESKQGAKDGWSEAKAAASNCVTMRSSLVLHGAITNKNLLLVA